MESEALVQDAIDRLITMQSATVPNSVGCNVSILKM